MVLRNVCPSIVKFQHSACQILQIQYSVSPILKFQDPPRHISVFSLPNVENSRFGTHRDNSRCTVQLTTLF